MPAPHPLHSDTHIHPSAMGWNIHLTTTARRVLTQLNGAHPSTMGCNTLTDYRVLPTAEWAHPSAMGYIVPTSYRVLSQGMNMQPSTMGCNAPNNYRVFPTAEWVTTHSIHVGIYMYTLLHTSLSNGMQYTH